MRAFIRMLQCNAAYLCACPFCGAQSGLRQEGRVVQAWLDLLRHPMHGSGNPVPRDIERGGSHREQLSMLHAKLGDYAHRAVRVGHQTRRGTHVSAGPVIKPATSSTTFAAAICMALACAA